MLTLSMLEVVKIQFMATMVWTSSTLDLVGEILLSEAQTVTPSVLMMVVTLFGLEPVRTVRLNKFISMALAQTH